MAILNRYHQYTTSSSRGNLQQSLTPAAALQQSLSRMKLTVRASNTPSCKTVDRCGGQVFPSHGNRPGTGRAATAQDAMPVARIRKPWRKTVQGLRSERVGMYFPRENWPNLSLGEKMQQINNDPRKQLWKTAESYVEFERPAGC